MRFQHRNYRYYQRLFDIDVGPSLGYVNQTAVNVHLNSVSVCCGNMFGGQTLFTDALGLCLSSNSIFAGRYSSLVIILNLRFCKYVLLVKIKKL